MFRMLTRALTVLVVAGAITFVHPGMSGATVPDCKTVSADLVRPDSGTAGDWAVDTFHRTVKICHAEVTAKTAVEVQSWTYTAVGVDSGTFKTKGATSFKGAAMKDGVTGKFSGHFELTFEAPKDWGLYAGAPADGSKYSTGEWLSHLWTDGFKPGHFTWAWTYTTCDKHGEYLLNAVTGNKGDITGKRACASPSPSATPSHSPHASPTAGGTGTGTPSLPVTGPAVGGLVALGLVLTVGGIALVVRRRRSGEGGSGGNYHFTA